MGPYILAAFGDNTEHLKTVLVSFGTIALVGWLIVKIVKGEHRDAWVAIPLVIFVLILATSAGVVYFRDTGLSILKTIFGGA